MKNVFCGLLIVFAVYLFQNAEASSDKVVTCYFGSWSVYRHGNGKFDVEDIDPTLCTNLIYTFVGLSSDGTVRVLDSWNDLEDNYGKGAFKRFNKLREINPKAKTFIAIGGWNEGSERYSQVMANDGLRAKFVESAVAFVKQYGFDGFDLDWEYPNQRGGQPHDVQNFSKLLREMRAAFDKEGLLLSAAVAAAEFSMSQSYEVPELSKYLDHINVMTYDLHGSWDKKTGHNAPLNPSSKDVSELEKQLNVIACINTWISKGADPKKIVLGMGTYGRTFTLDDPNNHGIGAPAANPGSAGPYTSQPGMLGYNEIVELQKQGGWTVVWDEEQEVPYAYKGNQWVGYDDPKSIKQKVKFINAKGLGGAMIWSVETDDFLGISGVKFPLLRAINEELGIDIPEPSSTEKPSSTTSGPTSSTEKPTTRPPNPGDLCQKEGYIRDPVDCGKFYYCVPLTEGGFKQVEFHCSEGLVFDPATLSCNYPWLVEC